MPRQKFTPKKLNQSKSNLSFISDIDYIPKKKKRRSYSAGQNYIIIPINEDHKQYYLGQLTIGTTNNIIPESWSTCKATFIPDENDNEKDEIIVFNFDSTSVLVKVSLDDFLIKDILKSKIFALNIIGNDDNVLLDIYFNELPLKKFYNKIGNCLKTLFFLLYDTPINNCDKKLKDLECKDISEIFDNIKSFKKSFNDEKLITSLKDVQHSRLKPTLRPYQIDAVNWMISREQENTLIEYDNPLYIKIKLKSGLEIYFDQYSGYVEMNRPIIKETLKGGILADEMGLGKTVEVLACLLSNPHPSISDNYNDFDKQNLPINIIINRRNKRRNKQQNEVTNSNIDKPKMIKVPNDWEKPKKTETRVALENWYESCLAEVNVKSKINNLPKVQCICGDLYESDIVTCVDCNRMQHAPCLGYKRNYGSYICPLCWTNKELVECKGTLIVCPVSLRKQWRTEIINHIMGDFKIFQYDGCSITSVYPMNFQDYDIVITTYTVLQNEIRLTENDKEMVFRHQRKYSRQFCPLTRVKWWRLILDEAQTVESPSHMVSQMARKLHAHYRWAVTGTPISRDISDFYGLIDYLLIEPYNDEDTWNHLLLNPYLNGNTKPLYEFLSKVMWRSTKNEVIDQINIPKQEIKENWLTFSAIEKHFYKCEHQANAKSFYSKIHSYDLNTNLNSLDKSTLKNVLAPLLSLRKVCTFPNVTKISYLASKKTVTSMQELLKAVIDKNSTENEDFLRIVISCLNGLAGIYLLLDNPLQAIEEYRRVLQLYTRFTEEKNSVFITIDKLQIIHTMYNLAEILETYTDIYSPTLRDKTLRDDCCTLEKGYIKKFALKAFVAFEENQIAFNVVQNLQKDFLLKPGEWYNRIIPWIYNNNYYNELKSRIDTAHENACVDYSIDLIDGVLFKIHLSTWDNELHTLRDETIDIINKLFNYDPDDDMKLSVDDNIVKQATDCHLRQQKSNTDKNKRRCPICKANEKLKQYELKLFALKKRGKFFEEMSLKGSWKPKSEELIFKSILSLIKVRNADTDVIKDGETHINLIESLKKEFKEIRKLWTMIDQLVCAKDELDMCKIRLRLKQPDDNNDNKSRKDKSKTLKNLSYVIENKTETIFMLEEHELVYQQTLLHCGNTENMVKLEKNLGTRSYLETLRKQQFENQSPDPCPICKSDLENHWSIIPCGHCYCIECMQSLIKYESDFIQCSVCRRKHHIKDISYIKPGPTSNGECEESEIKGNYSTKIEAIIKLLIYLKKNEENVKVLIFSKWLSVLKNLKSAMIYNDITCEIVISSNLEKQIFRFKDNEYNITALLLPINLGSKGLNLIEATHVILVEPLLNPSDELQAIGRVHRIGQTKPTTVHKFIIKNTIEENIYNAINSNVDKWDKSKVTLSQVMELFNYEGDEQD